MKKSCVCFLENVGCIPLAVVIMTTANGMRPTFSGMHTQLFFIISDLYRPSPTSHGNFRSVLNPGYVKVGEAIFYCKTKVSLFQIPH